MEDILFGFLSKTLNLDNDRLAEILFKKADDDSFTNEITDNALSDLLRLDSERVQKIRPDTKAIFDNGYKKAEKEIAERWEKMLREKFGITDDQVQGEALIDAAKAALSQEGVKPDKIKTSKEYLELESKMKTTLADKEKELADKIAEMQAQFTKEQTWQQVSAKIRQGLLELNPMLPTDASKADRMIDLFMQQFRDYDFQADEKEGFIPLQNGQRIEDQHGYARALADLVKERADLMFEFKEQDPAGNAGNRNAVPNGKTSTARFKNENEYLKAYAEATTPEARESLYNSWTAQKQ